MAKVTDLSELTSAADGDKIHIVDVSDATDDAEGSSKYIQKSNLVQLASAAETTTATSAAKSITPNALRGSQFGYRTLEVQLLNSGKPLTVTDQISNYTFTVPAWMDGWNLVDIDFSVDTVSSSGTPTFQVYNITQAVDMLSTAVTIDANENNSFTAATQPAIDTANDDVSAGDRIQFDCDVAGTGTQGCTVIAVFQKPGA